MGGILSVPGRIYLPAIPIALGFGARRLRFTRLALLYLNQAVLPFYVVHQTVLLTVGFYIVRWTVPDLVKWAVIATSSFAACALIYEFGIRRFNATRFLFGLRPRRPAAGDEQKTTF